MKINFKKELRDWGFIIVVFGILYITGAYTEVAAFTQRMVLATGIVSPDTSMPESEKQRADYDFNILTFENEKIDFNALKGKVVFLNFWASWCPPCIAEMPGIENLYNQYKDRKDIEFVMINLDSDIVKAEKFIARKEFTFPVYKPDLSTGIPGMYNSPSIPTTFVISKSGLIDSKKVGMASYDSKKFRNYLNKLLED